jgi:hypothetical protein
MSLDDTREELIEHIKETLSVVVAGTPMGEMGELFQDLTLAFESLGICNLLRELDAPGFHRNLWQSACAWRYFLRKSQQHGSTDTIFTALSRSDAIFDGIVSGDRQVVGDLVRWSATQWMPDAEYEDDFAYRAVIHAHVASVAGAPSNAPSQRLQEFIAVADGSDVRVPLCEKFVRKEEGDFWKAFAEFIDDRVAQAAKPVYSDAPWIEPRRHVCVEGLAWLALAESLGFRPPETEYTLCPSVAEVPAQPPVEEDILVRIERDFGL